MNLLNASIQSSHSTTLHRHTTDSMKGLVLPSATLKHQSEILATREPDAASKPGSLVPGCASLPVPGSRSTRMTFHNIPVDLPPPPASGQHHLCEHAYLKQ